MPPASQLAKLARLATTTGQDLAGLKPMSPLPRLVLRASPGTLTAVAEIAEQLPIAGSPALSFGPVLSMAVNLLTGGVIITPDESLPGGAWVIEADGRELARGTVDL
jgi:hypothetical protein